MTNPSTFDADANVGPEITDWKPYIRAGKIGLLSIWFLVIAFVLLWPSKYTSTWALMVLNKDSAVTLKLDGIGQATTSSVSRPSDFQDPRLDYIYIATSVDTLTAAATRVDLDVDDYGEPSLQSEEKSALIKVDVTGNTPEVAQNKSIALYEVLFEKIESLRQQEMARRRAETMLALEHDQNTLELAQEKMASFKAQSPFHSADQLTSLSSSIEGLRTKLAEKQAAMKGIGQKLLGFSRETSESKLMIQDVYILQSDPVYQMQLKAYADVYSRYSGLEAGLGLNNPTLLQTKGELDTTLYAMRQRASFLLGEEVSERLLISLNSLVWAESRGEYDFLEAEVKELENQISLLDERLNLLDREQSLFSSIQADFLVAESVLAATLGKLNFNQGDIYAIYPPIQLAVAPNLPDDPSMPDLKISFLAGVVASFMWVAFLVFLKWERNSPWRNPRSWIP